MLIAIGGEYAAVKSPKGGVPDRREWKRGQCLAFSPRSRSRMIQSIAKIDVRNLVQLVFFVTLTYPRNWRHDAPTWKRDLEVWGKRIKRRYPEAFAYWKLEFQERGAPHFHILLFGLHRVDSQWLHGIWYEIINSTDRYHWRYGTDVKPVREWAQVGRYCSKYCAKVDENPAPDGVGRYWGIQHRKNRKESVVRVAVTEEEYYRVRRVFKRVLGVRRGYHTPGGRDSGVWCRISNSAAKRALGWATGEQPTHGSPSGTMFDDRADVYGRHGHDTYRSSTDDLLADLRMSIVHIDGRTSVALFDRADLDRRRWGRYA